ncbi:Aste57867_13082 [Aphanomyces stellatus]|uniref:Aste57867_13082 protein n=1 Tax=Aphanomyces stellatus TaxID=120398 RepID=A0A485KXJ4_9STRA|nr:hypothetical protein As57867_013034 [Aphanomyces stellatus]VFT89926.1 Aste57867_13082 [Aphanomyces stellatus]
MERTPLLKKSQSLGDSCPERKGCLSQMLFTWMNPLMELGNKRPLEMDDLFRLNPELRADAASARFEKHWALELEKTCPSLPYALFCAFGGKFLAAGLLRLIRDTLQFIGPYVIQRVIAYLLTPEAPPMEGAICTLLIFVGGILQSFCFRNYMYLVFETGLLCRTALVTAVYQKALRLSSTARSKRSSGEITNLLSIDAQRLQDLTADLHAVWYAPFLIIVACTLLYFELGIAAVAAVGVVFFFAPISLCISRVMRSLQTSLMAVKDDRVKLIFEVLSGIKVVKLQAWEDSMKNRVVAARRSELSRLKAYLMARTASASLFSGVPALVTAAIFACFVLLGRTLSTSAALTSVSLIAIMRYPLFVLPSVVNAIVEASVSCARIQSFLLDSERTPVGPGELTSPGLILRGAAFSWTFEDGDALTDVSLAMHDTGLCAVVGAVGSGKSTLLAGLLGDVACTQGSVALRGNVAYVAQQPFIQNATVRDNICFGLPYEYGRYTATVRACCLEQDMKTLPAGDLTEIGEKGVNLSGGQRARVALARAVYQDADVYLLDDILAAVDAHVGATIFADCIRTLLAGKLVVLVTHSLAILPQCDSVLVLAQGRVVDHGSYETLVYRKDGALAGMVAAAEASDASTGPSSIDDEDSIEDFGTSPTQQLRRTPSSEVLETSGSLMTDEDRSTGDVPWSVFAVWISSCGGVLPAAGVLFVFALTQAINIAATLWLGAWADTDATLTPPARRTQLYVFLGLNVGYALLVFVRVQLMYVAGLRGSRRLFDAVLTRVLRAPMRFFDTTPLGRVVNRLSKDVYTVDEDIPSAWANVLITVFGVGATLATIVVVTPWFAAALIPLMLFYYHSQRYFIKTSRELQRLDSVSRSPIVALAAETLDGLPTIRAFAVEPTFVRRHEFLVDRNQRAYYLNFSANCWLGLRLEFTGAMVASLATLCIVLQHDSATPVFAALAGVSLSYAFSVTPALNMSVRYLSQLQTQMVSVERLHTYTSMPTEAALRTTSCPRDWPSDGAITFEQVDLRYRLGLPRVLRQLTCAIRGREKIGVVGRTGAGKSSLVVALLRLAEIHGGRITLDGVDIATLGLHDLREQFAVIPQDPVLFSGSVRSNLDPFGAFDDAALFAALRRVRLETSLDDTVDERGLNWSVGERQLLCIARALLRRSKVILMDEATASIDADTDRLVQRSIRQVFSDCTCLTIAHRLHTIMDSDRILVMDRGAAVEFDTPHNLLKQRGGIFTALVAAHSNASSSKKE